MIADPDRDDEYLVAACQTMRASAGPAALDALGWWDLLPDLDEEDARTAAFAVFRAQGRELNSAVALGALLAQPFVERTAIAPGTVVAAVLRHSNRRGPVWVVVGDARTVRPQLDSLGLPVEVVPAQAVAEQPAPTPVATGR